MQSERYHSFDSLRAAMMLLEIWGGWLELGAGTLLAVAGHGVFLGVVP